MISLSNDLNWTIWSKTTAETCQTHGSFFEQPIGLLLLIIRPSSCWKYQSVVQTTVQIIDYHRRQTITFWKYTDCFQNEPCRSLTKDESQADLSLSSVLFDSRRSCISPSTLSWLCLVRVDSVRLDITFYIQATLWSCLRNNLENNVLFSGRRT